MSERIAYVKLGDMLVPHKGYADLYKVVKKKPNRKTYQIFNVDFGYSAGWFSHSQVKKLFRDFDIIKETNLTRLLYV